MFTLPRDITLAGLVWLQTGLHRDRGQTLGEYALLIALVAVGTTLIALISFRTQLQTGFAQMSSCLLGSC